MPDNDIDELIRDALRTRPVIATHQKRAAYARLVRATHQQSVLPPLAAPASRWNRIKAQGEALGRWIGSFMADEANYERARRHRLAYPTWSSGYGGSGLAVQIFEPRGYSLGVPV
jgi:hypothetical protein